MPSFYGALRAGRNFVTNGPVLTFEVNSLMPGDTIRLQPSRLLQVLVKAQARERIDRIEIVANGRIIADAPGSKLEAEIEPKNFTWLAARCYLKPGATLRLAHTSPIYLQGPAQAWDSSDDAMYFVKWIDELILETKADATRFSSDDQREEVLQVYNSAKEYYVKRAHQHA